ncbi:MAG: dihydrofolate reductase family protein, partial [Solirubrobacterales bacterium]
LGPHEILSALGAGGMGEVYRARDTKLNRDVAIKVLLPAVANDPDRLARLEAAGAEVLSTGGGGRRERFLEAMDLLGERGISSILLEGGPVLAGVALDSGEVDRFEVFVAPIVLGGGRAAVEGEGPLKVDDAMRVGNMLVTRVGQDVHMSAQMKAW